MKLNLSELMREWRRLWGLSQMVAAEKAGISRVQWGRIESGAIAYRERTAQRILRSLGMIPENAAVEGDDLSFNDWTRCPLHPSREVPVRGGKAYCARCGGWHSVAGVLDAENSPTTIYETARM